MTPLYDQGERHARQEFMNMIAAACAPRGIHLSWFANDWVAKLQKGSSVQFITGYTFPLNTAATNKIINDKSAAYTILTDAGVPSIPHHLLRLPAQRDTSYATTAILRHESLPVVVKPNTGEGGGFDVHKCTSQSELAQAVVQLASRHRTIAVAPFVHITREFRVVILHKAPLVIFEKVRQAPEWRHNLKLGALPHVVTDAAVHSQLAALAAHAVAAVQGQIAVVDIADTPHGYQIVELNGGVALSRFAALSASNAALAQCVYDRIIESCI